MGRRRARNEQPTIVICEQQENNWQTERSKILKVQKMLLRIIFLKLCYLNISSNFELIELYLFFSKIFSKIVNFDLKNFCCRNSGLRNFQKTLRKSIFQYWYFWMIQKILNLLSYTCFFKKIV